MSEDWRTRQAAWDAAWQDIYDRARRLRLSPNEAVLRANHLMDLHGYGPRPEPKETTK